MRSRSALGRSRKGLGCNGGQSPSSSRRPDFVTRYSKCIRPREGRSRDRIVCHARLSPGLCRDTEANIDTRRSVRASDAIVFYDLAPLPELAELGRSVPAGGEKVFGDDHLKRLTPMSLAIWYQDGGTFDSRCCRSEVDVDAMVWHL